MWGHASVGLGFSCAPVLNFPMCAAYYIVNYRELLSTYSSGQNHEGGSFLIPVLQRQLRA